MSNIIKIDTAKIDEYITRLNNIINSANDLNDNLSWYARQRGYDNVIWTLNNVGKPADFVWRIKKNIDYLDSVRTKANDLENFLSQIDPLNYDKSLAVVESRNSKFLDTVFKSLTQLELVGSMINWGKSMSQIVAGDFGDVVKGIAGGMDFIAKSIDVVFDKDGFMGIFGDLKKVLVKGNDFFKNVKEGFTSTFTDFVDTSKGALKTVTKWTGSICDFVVEGYENYEEFGEVSGRMVAETVIEGGTEIVLDATFNAASAGIFALAGAGITAIIGAPFAFPGIIVGIGGIALKGVADWACEKFFGKNMAECVSDFVCDIFGKEDNEVREADIEADSKAYAT